MLAAATLTAAPSAQATGAGGTPPPAAAAGKAAAPALSPQAQAILTARAKAKATGQPVSVDVLTDEASDTVVNPNGTLTTTSHAEPVRVRRGTGWAAVDATLHLNADGTVSPAALPADLTLSGGGAGPLAVLADSGGRKLAVNAPFTLPKPTLSGDTATYPGVLGPDVDLQVTALPTGGWRDVIVVKTAAAAARPELKKLHFPVSGGGLSTSSDAAGNIAFKDAGGTERFSSPPPLQWDSSTAAPAGGSTPAGAPQARKPAASGSGAANAAAGDEADTSSAAEPGDHATVAPIAVSTSGGAVDLTPDQNALGHGTGPWFLDPSISVTTSGASQQSVEVQENHPEAENADQLAQLGTGYCGYSDCTGYGRYRAYYRIGVPSQLTDSSTSHGPQTVYSATLYTQVTSAAAPGTPTPMGLYWTGPINQWTRWDAQPCGTNGTMAGCTKIGDNWMDPAGPMTYSVTSQMQQASAGKWPDFTIGLAPDDENNAAYRHHFANNPYIVTNYDVAPTIWGPSTTPTPGFADTGAQAPCTSGGTNAWDNPGWLGSNQNIQLNVNLWSPTNLPVTTVYHLWGSGGAADNQTITVDNGISYGTSHAGVGGLKDGHVYGWYADNYDAEPISNGLGSSDSPQCYFGVDQTAPTVGISSTAFPPSGTPNDNPQYFANHPEKPGTFQLNASDPAPAAGGSASGVACIRWATTALDASVTGWQCGQSDTTSGASGSFAFSPSLWGTNVVYAQSKDRAGNYSQLAQYTFYAPWDKNATPVFGDVTGDRRPDILLPDGSGNLHYVGANTDAARSLAAQATAAPGAQDPAFQGADSWADYQLTHRGSLQSGSFVDDVIAHNTTTPALKANLYRLKNDGMGNFLGKPTQLTKPTSCRDANNVSASCATLGMPPDWSQATQVLALGTPTGESTTPVTTTNPDGSTTTKYVVSQTWLLAVENKNLWLYAPTPGGTLAYARLLSTSGTWDQYDLIAPGPAGGDSNSKATLWSRAQDGTIRSYSLGSATAPDYSAFADPAKGTTILTGATRAAYPRIGSSGDLNGDGVPDLWALNSQGHLVSWPGATAAGSNAVTSFSTGQNGAPAADLGLVTVAIGPDGNGRTDLPAGTVLHSGDTVYAAHTRLAMQSDGNLVLYSLNSGAALWSTGTYNHPGAWAAFQSDGNLVVYQPQQDPVTGSPVYPVPGTSAYALWNTGGHPGGVRASVQDDSNFVIYDANTNPLWSSGTWQPNP
ncbi:hypothetical protein OG455_30635 [Kitasatospora sp. NBC_01287]|uniref:hypothetical protein n=1 Tax=Kitasatospora sp. NBC_01287 TaxID=2903573 RepID=UPI0022529E1F|nr:hypothetical protein [Kitasatospora sp. NBC_01287]MCX4749822.1 hypothetical protein [Kitasatospora sp. NBC_01287]